MAIERDLIRAWLDKDDREKSAKDVLGAGKKSLMSLIKEIEPEDIGLGAPGTLGRFSEVVAGLDDVGDPTTRPFEELMMKKFEGDPVLMRYAEAKTPQGHWPTRADVREFGEEPYGEGPGGRYVPHPDDPSLEINPADMSTRPSQRRQEDPSGFKKMIIDLFDRMGG